MPDLSPVLIVDDHPRMGALIQRWLGRADYQVIGVTTVPDAIEALTAHAITLSAPPHAAGVSYASIGRDRLGGAKRLSEHCSGCRSLCTMVAGSLPE